MRVNGRILPSVVTAALLSVAGGVGGVLSPAVHAAVPAPQGGAREPVIVFLKAAGSAEPGAGRSGPWNRVLAYAGQAEAGGATEVRPYHLVPAFSARVTAAEAGRLQASPGVAEVIPDSLITGANPAASAVGGTGTAPAKAGRPKAGLAKTGLAKTGLASAVPVKTKTVRFKTSPGACSPSGTAQLTPEGLGLTHTDSVAKGARTARSLGYTGAGVKVAFIADGLDPRNVNFLRPNGSTAVVDYRDFSGDGQNAPTAGGEAFLDATSIAGQGLHVYDVGDFAAQPTATPCRTRIEGIAPGASLVALKAFPNQNVTATSAFLQAIDYAVTTEHVNVLSESFSSNPLPDVGALDAVEQFDDAASAAGVTVVVSSGDAGPFGTIGSPASDPNVLSVGASTQFRYYAQTNFAGAALFAPHGWLNDNISALSSGGFTQSGRVIDMVAPGDLSFASCDADTKRYSDCHDLHGQPSDLEMAGGTSEAAPLVAGAAALVIQAYRKAHHGVTPSPATVQQILMSTASDLGAPADLQGAGLLNTLKAVEAASRSGDSLLISPASHASGGQLDYAGPAGSRASWPVTVTNAGVHAATVWLAGRSFGAPRAVARTSVTLSDSAGGHFTSWSGDAENDASTQFTVPAGAGLLTADIGYPVTPASASSLAGRVRFDLIDPEGRLAAQSEPQGVSGYGSASVLRPSAGTWTAIVMSSASSANGTTGTVQFGASVSTPVPFGSATPSYVRLRPGQSAAVTVSAVVPAGSGDVSGSIVVTNSLGTGPVTIPVALRGLIAMHQSASSAGTWSGTFSGTGTGGNGRTGAGQMTSYQFGVPRGIRSLEADVTLPQPSANEVTSYLVAPDGLTVGYGSSYLTTGFASGRVPVDSPQSGVSAFAADPVQGTWTLVLNFDGPAADASLGEPFQGTIRFNAARVTATGLPDSAATVLVAGQPVTVPVRITNTGVAPENIFTDPRLATTVSYQLQPQSQVTGVGLPLKPTANLPEWIVPTNTSSLHVTAASASATKGGKLPRIMFDYGPFPGDPDQSSATGTTATASFPGSPPGTAGTGPGSQVDAGLWFAIPAQVGPYPSGGAPAATASLTMTASAAGFDTAATSSPGDFWWFTAASTAAKASYSLLPVNPGQTVTITVKLIPSGAHHSVVRGTLYADDFVDSTTFLSGSEIAALPYEYTIK
jgi:hypothetical protein